MSIATGQMDKRGILDERGSQRYLSRRVAACNLLLAETQFILNQDTEYSLSLDYSVLNGIVLFVL
ncbi:hypothetical protein ACTXT7_012963 [Hymenolepis weldensis]